jgi:CRP-like cAMP-binding protein
MEFAAGKVICDQDGKRRPLIVSSGLVKEEVLTEDGQEVILRFHVPGDVFGLPGEQTRLVALASTVLQPIDLTSESMRVLTGIRLRETQARLIDALSVGRPVGDTLAVMLISLANRLRNNLIPIREYDLAAALGTTIYTISRLANHWRRIGAIEIVRHTRDNRARDGAQIKFMKILDREKLLTAHVPASHPKEACTTTVQ